MLKEQEGIAMKKIYHSILLLMIISVGVLSMPNIALSASLDINGQIIEEDGKQLTVSNGITTVSEEFLKNTLYLKVEKEKERFTLSNAYHDFTIEGTVGSDKITFNGKKITLQAAASEKNNELYVPLRPIISLFGDIEWNDEYKRIIARYDYNAQLDIPLAEISTENMDYDIPMNSGIGPMDGMTPVSQDENGIIFEKRDENGMLKSVGTANKDIISPVHQDYVLRGSAYAIEKDYLYWIEYPNASAEVNNNQNWYLYMKERKKNAEPICIDQDSFTDLTNINYGESILDNCDFKNGNIIWFRANLTDGVAEVKLYQHKSGLTKVLDAMPLGQNNFSFEVAVGETDAFWTRANFMEAMREYGTMYRADLKTGEIEPFSQGYNLLNPKIVGDYLIVRMKPDGHNFIPNTENSGTYTSGELCVYDLKKDEWSFKIDNSLPTIGKEAVIICANKLNNTHITVTLEGAYNNRGMTVIDLKNGKVYEAVNKKGEPLRYVPYDAVNEAFVQVYSEASDGACMMTFRRMKDNVASFSSYPVYFKW